MLCNWLQLQLELWLLISVSTTRKSETIEENIISVSVVHVRIRTPWAPSSFLSYQLLIYSKGHKYEKDVQMTHIIVTWLYSGWKRTLKSASNPTPFNVKRRVIWTSTCPLSLKCDCPCSLRSLGEYWQKTWENCENKSGQLMLQTIFPDALRSFLP